MCARFLTSLSFAACPGSRGIASTGTTLMRTGAAPASSSAVMSAWRTRAVVSTLAAGRSTTSTSTLSALWMIWYWQSSLRSGSPLVSGTGPAHPLLRLGAGRAGPGGRRALRRAVRDEVLEADSPPRSLIAEMLYTRVVDESEKTPSETRVSPDTCAIVRIAHSRMRTAVACGQPCRGRSIASSRSTSTWVASRSA